MKKNIRVYEYLNCSTCKNALRFLEKRGVEFESIPIVDQPPTLIELKRMLGYLDGELRRLFNTSGQLYREMKIREKLPKLSETEALKLLATHGKLIKRPFLLTANSGIVGFKEAEWDKFFS